MADVGVVVADAGTVSGVAAAIRLPDWLAPWVPPEIVSSLVALMAGLGPVVDALLQAAPRWPVA